MFCFLIDLLDGLFFFPSPPPPLLFSLRRMREPAQKVLSDLWSSLLEFTLIYRVSFFFIIVVIIIIISPSVPVNWCKMYMLTSSCIFM